MEGAGYHVYPAFVDLWADYGLPPEPKKEKNPQTAYDSERLGPVGRFESNRADYRAARLFNPDEKQAAAYRKAGIGAVLTHKAMGNIRGSAALVGTGTENASHEILKGVAAFVFSLNKTEYIRQFYPTSLAGAIALIRQAFLDADWYKKTGQKTTYYETLEHFNEVVPKQPLLCEVMDKYDVFRMQEVAREFGVSFIYKGAGNEYQRVEDLARQKAPLIIPLKTPEGWDVRHPEETEALSFSALKHWELAPHNAVFLNRHGLSFAFTATGLKEPSEIWEVLRRLIRNGLPETEALRAFTITPASYLGLTGQLGVLRPGAWANFFLASGNPFQRPESLYYTVVKGRVYLNETPPILNVRGVYRLEIPELGFAEDVVLSGSPTRLRLKPKDKAQRLPAGEVSLQWDQLVFSSALPSDTGKVIRFTATLKPAVDLIIQGQCILPDGRSVSWTLVRLSEEFPDEDKPEALKPGTIPVPFAPQGIVPVPDRYDFVVRKATVWTNEKEGIREGWDVYVKQGKIAGVGPGLKVPAGTRELDGSGRHLTCGIIDEHSHIALTRGVNEWGSQASAEVRMADAVNPDDEDIYFQLAGGVTAAQLLHGSANPIGGQSALVKFRWGALPQKMLVEGADNFIKFALGENVKQGNNPLDGYRYPQSRTGVEATFYYYFHLARAYGDKLKKDPQNTRRDLRLETLLRILEKKCFITCHSYVQSEINMLMKLADSLGFKVNTFTHILEGYKVADKMKAHGVHASSFSDWWAYKWEVMEAIPYNPSLLLRVGVNTAINSDDAEMARRLNQEAAKVVKYGGISEEEAWKTVTLNPAKMLHLDHRMGSIRVGKDADLVLWDGPPLSVYSKPLFTWVDGVEMFSLERDNKIREVVRNERQRLIALMEKTPGNKKRPEASPERHYHCDTLDEAWEMND